MSASLKCFEDTVHQLSPVIVEFVEWLCVVCSWLGWIWRDGFGWEEFEFESILGKFDVDVELMVS
jgi:hypothetical protein